MDKVELRATTVYFLDEGKVYRSQNAGVTWEAVAERQKLRSGDLGIIYDFAVSPSNPNIMYLATKGGMWRSVNAGRSWVLYDNGINSDSIFELFATKSMVLARGVYGVYRLSDKELSWAVDSWQKYESPALNR